MKVGVILQNVALDNWKLLLNSKIYDRKDIVRETELAMISMQTLFACNKSLIG